MITKWIASLTLSGVLILSACGEPSRQSGTGAGISEPHDGSFEPDPSMWKLPLGDEGVEVPNSSKASLPFVPMEPEGLGPASAIFSTRVGLTAPLERRIAWLYEASEYGTFVLLEEIVPGGSAGQAVLEEPADLPTECRTIPFNEKEAEQLGEGGYREICTYGDAFSIVTIREGARALLTEGGALTVLQWLEPVEFRDERASQGLTYPVALQLTIQGPAADLSPQEAILLAETM